MYAHQVCGVLIAITASQTGTQKSYDLKSVKLKF